MNTRTCMVLVPAVLLMTLAMTAAGTDNPLQWQTQAGSILYRHAPSYPFIDRESDRAIAASLRATGRVSDDRKVEIEFDVSNTGRRSIVLYNPGFNELAPAAGEIVAFDMGGVYERPLNWPPAGFRTKRDDWVNLEKGQRIVTTRWVQLPPGKHMIQIIYWRRLLTPRPKENEDMPSFMPENELGGRTEIMRSNSIEVEVLKPAADPSVSSTTRSTARSQIEAELAWEASAIAAFVWKYADAGGQTVFKDLEERLMWKECLFTPYPY